MNIKSLLFASALSLLASSAWAQSASQPLNLKLPNNLPAASSSSASAASASAASTPAATSVHPDAVSQVNASPAKTAVPLSTTPGVYYGDTSGRMGDTGSGSSQACDDYEYGKAQVHGAVSTGIASGSHTGTSTYEGGTVNVTKAFGDGDHPAGGVSFSISVDQQHFNGGGRYRGYGY